MMNSEFLKKELASREQLIKNAEIKDGIEFVRTAGKLLRVCRPFSGGLPFFMPMNSVEEEVALREKRKKDQKVHGKPLFPSPNDYMDADDLRDHHNDTSFQNHPSSVDLNK
jgi:hypothetical protein